MNKHEWLTDDLGECDLQKRLVCAVAAVAHELERMNDLREFPSEVSADNE